MDDPHTAGVSIETFFKWGGYIAALILGFWKLLRKKKPDADKPVIVIPPTPPINYGIAISITELLVELRIESRSDRAQVFLFKNGEHYIVSNTSVQRFNCPYERMAPGIAPVAEQFEGSLISSYIDGLEKIVEAEGKAAIITRDELPDGAWKTAMIKTGAHMQVGIALTWRGSIIGFLLTTYLDEDRKPNTCSFDALVEEGGLIKTDTCEMVRRHCKGSCPDCHYREYIARLEDLLAQGI